MAESIIIWNRFRSLELKENIVIYPSIPLTSGISSIETASLVANPNKPV